MFQLSGNRGSSGRGHNQVCAEHVLRKIYYTLRHISNENYLLAFLTLKISIYPSKFPKTGSFIHSCIHSGDL